MKHSPILVLILLASAIILTTQLAYPTVQAQDITKDNSAPTFNTPKSATIYYLYPRGAYAILDFNGEPVAIDADDDTITLEFSYSVDDQTKTLAELLLAVSHDSTNQTYSYSKSSDYSIAKYLAAYGDSGNPTTITATISATAENHTSTTNFEIVVQHDQAAQISSPAVFKDYNRWEIESHYKVYEGPTAAASFDWSSPHSDTSVDRLWHMAISSQGIQTSVSCNDNLATLADEAHVNWPNDDHDTQLFQTPANQATDTHDYPSGHVTVSFDNSDPEPEEGGLTLRYPDYENPHDHDKDNTYHLRVVNDNDLEEYTLGCTGSAVDLAITIKDVGPPAAPPDLTGAFQVGDATAMDVSWSEPSGFIENKVIIPFPHADLGVTKYQYQYRWDDQQPWSDVLETDDTSVSIPGLDQAGYHVQVRATSTEGEGDWSQIIVGTLSNRAPSITRPTNHDRDILYKFPDGKPAIVRYDQEPGSDPDGDPITYLFRIAVNFHGH